MNHAQTITLYQPLLHQIAYNILRCKADAEDMVQETFTRWLTIDQTKIENTKAYLMRAVTNNCLNHLATLKKTRFIDWEQVSVKDWMGKFKEIDLSHIDVEKELSAAFKVIQHKLEPLERAAYLLREVFDFDYHEIQEVLNKKADHCRQLFSRANKKLTAEKSKIHSGLPDTSHLFESFKKACHLQDAQEFIQQLKADVTQALAGKK
ncbi:MAG: sigma-70 family RNA polymerase sigma factor [Cyclobacteriaceae bacterium]|nr:sigma-70 family RNA polymerase sigma factor [Cyclobacteriaceae bacterium]MBX2916401.1 sigma-70 family RNA polymerase sigma factor [Cyclobacteriaceae bacterium]